MIWWAALFPRKTRRSPPRDENPERSTGGLGILAGHPVTGTCAHLIPRIEFHGFVDAP